MRARGGHEIHIAQHKLLRPQGRPFEANQRAAKLRRRLLLEPAQMRRQ